MTDNYRELSAMELDQISGGNGWLQDVGEFLGRKFAEGVEFLAVNTPDNSGAYALAKIGNP